MTKSQQRVPKRVTCILIESPMLATRFWLIIGSLTWAFLLLFPSQLFPTPEQLQQGCSTANLCRTTYQLMASVASETLWGLAFLVQSLWAWYTLRTGVRDRSALIMDAFFGCLLWTSSTLLCFAAHWPHHITTGFIDQLLKYPMPAAMSGEAALTAAAWWHLVRYWSEEETTDA